MIFGNNFARNYEKIMILGTSDTWSTSHSFHRPSKPAYYIADWRISKLLVYISSNGCNQSMHTNAKNFICFYGNSSDKQQQKKDFVFDHLCLVCGWSNENDRNAPRKMSRLMSFLLTFFKTKYPQKNWNRLTNNLGNAFFRHL